MEVLIWLILGQLGTTDPTARARWTVVATVLALPLLAPKDSVRYWFHTVADVNRVTPNDRIPYFDTSLNGLLARLNVPDLTVTYVVLGGVVALWSGCVASCYWVVLIMLESPVPAAMPQIFPHMYLATGVGTLAAYRPALYRSVNTITEVLGGSRLA